GRARARLRRAPDRVEDEPEGGFRIGPDRSKYVAVGPLAFAGEHTAATRPDGRRPTERRACGRGRPPPARRSAVASAVVLDPAFQAALEAALGHDQLVREPEQLRTYECDGLTGRRVVPALVVLAESAADVQATVRACNEFSVPFVARGAGTGLSGGALPVAEGIVISLARLTRILEVDVERGCVTVEPGVANLDVTKAVAAEGFYYAPDPSSQQVCTIGGNVAENSGG